MQMKKALHLHPLFFLLGSLFFLYSQSAVIVSPDQLVRPFLVLSAILILFAWPARWLTGDWGWVSFLLTVTVLGFFSSKSYFMAAGVVSISALGLWFGIFRLRKIPTGIERVSGILTLASLLLALLVALPLVRAWAKIPNVDIRSDDAIPIQTSSVTSTPDIYYIILDGYARADVLTELYRFDNADFVRTLESRGFFVPDESRANYPKTAVSVTSTLNMDYIDSLAPGLEDQPFWWLMSPLLDHSRVRATLEKLGYQTVSLTSDWGITDNPTADVYYSPKPIVFSDFESYLLSQTPLGMVESLLGRVAFVPSFEAHRELTRFQFETLADVPSLPGPKFVVAHIVAPHPPFVFDAQGNPLEPAYPFSFHDANDFPFGDEAYRQGYVGQVEYVNGQVVQMIDAILAKSVTPPIIILQADHGPGMLTDFRSSANTCLKERFSIFAAYYLPGVNPDAIPADVTPVNLFRILFNEYFHAELPLLERAHFYYKDTVYIFRAEDVTEQVDTCTGQ
jgi:hypothetical protein